MSFRDTISEQLYSDNCNYDDQLQDEVKKYSTHQSSPISPFISTVLRSLLGIQSSSSSRPFLGTCFYVVTMASAICFCITHTWFVVYDIVNVNSRRTLLTGLVSITMCLYYAAIGVYANQLAAKLLSRQSFLVNVRMHTRTLFKVNAGLVITAIGLTITVLSNYSAYLGTDRCRKLNLDSAVCVTVAISRATYSLFSLLWNLVIGVILLSVCRTHTIGIRRLILELRQDAIEIERSASMNRLICETLESNNENVENPQINSENSIAEDPQININYELCDSTSASVKTILTNDEILMRYWKISTRLNVTSNALQRWLIAWIVLIVFSSVSYIIYWITHESTLLGISLFSLPIMLLPLVCSAYAEVNNEGVRLVKCICPTKDRLRLLMFMTQQPLQITAFGFAINYSAIVTAVGALSLAFCSRIILDEIKV